ncbi:LacI family transcriptional regulator [Nocardia sp. NBC_01377]|uniref:LacI family DNA-binding transcriptional regulator n=1 Tax=Nocardia sp. NBC_01377 TaxID=2903595 RepID=UPI00324393AE
MDGVKRSARPTRADVARLAEVSTATVTYVLNNVENQRISARTQQAVREAAAAIGYRPNLAARNLKVGASGLVLYVVPKMALHELAMEVSSRLTTALAGHGIVMSLQFETEDGANVAEAIASLDPIAVSSVFPLGGAALEAANAAKIPQIHLGSANLDSLASLHLIVGRMRVQHLLSRGHRRLGFAFSPNPKLRLLGEYWLEGVRAATTDHGIPAPVAAEILDDGSDAAEVVSRWVEQGVSAVCAQSDETAFAVLHGIRRAGLRCPDDLAVIGVDAIGLGALSDPPLTSVGFVAAAIVDTAVDAMMNALGLPPGDGDDAASELAVLIERDST